MDLNELSRNARALICPNSPMVEKHLEFLKQMISIDSRSFGVGEFVGDRTTPSDMVEILDLAEKYLRSIGFSKVLINRSPNQEKLPNPILMAEIKAGKDRPTLLFYAHLDKQPYMGDERFLRWGRTPPTQARWNTDKTRLYGRGAADDLAGVTAIGMTIETLLKSLKDGLEIPLVEIFNSLPCNIKIIYETEEESGSHSLIEQIQQNMEFFKDVDCVIITDVINPATGFPGLTTSLRGIVQIQVELEQKTNSTEIDAQTALYKLTSSLIKDDHSLAVHAISDADTPVTDEEAKGYGLVPTTIEDLRKGAGILPRVKATIGEDKSKMIQAQLRQSFVNTRHGNRVSGSIIFGAAGARLSFQKPSRFSGELFLISLENFLKEQNRFQLKLTVKEMLSWKKNWVFYDIVLRASNKDPHSGVHGGPFPIAELQLAKMIDNLVTDDGKLNLKDVDKKFCKIYPYLEALEINPDSTVKTFSNDNPIAIIEIRLGTGNREQDAKRSLVKHLYENLPSGFKMKLKEEKGTSPWITKIRHPVFPAIMSALEIGYDQKPCLYGCGGSIPFVPKLTDALGDVQPICLGAYDPESKMHEPGESLSMSDWLGCVRSMIHFVAHSKDIFSK